MMTCNQMETTVAIVSVKAELSADRVIITLSGMSREKAHKVATAMREVIRENSQRIFGDDAKWSNEQ
jgi:hypothetical protein